MNKFIKKSVACGIAAVMAIGATSMTAFAASSTVNSEASVNGDVVNITDTPIYSAAGANSNSTDYASAPVINEGEANEYTVAGYDSNDWCTTSGHTSAGNRATEYRDIQRRDAGDNIDGDYQVDVYASQEDGAVEIIVPKTIILDGDPDAVSNSGAYKVQAKGNIAGDEIVSVVPVTNATATGLGSANSTSIAEASTNAVSTYRPKFFMGQTGKQDIIATINQDDVYFATEGATENGGAPATWDGRRGAENEEASVVGLTGSHTLTGAVNTSSTKGLSASTLRDVASGTITVADLSAGMWHGNFNFHIAITDMETDAPVNIH